MREEKRVDPRAEGLGDGAEGDKAAWGAGVDDRVEEVRERAGVETHCEWGVSRAVGSDKRGWRDGNGESEEISGGARHVTSGIGDMLPPRE